MEGLAPHDPNEVTKDLRMDKISERTTTISLVESGLTVGEEHASLLDLQYLLYLRQVLWRGPKGPFQCSDAKTAAADKCSSVLKCVVGIPLTIGSMWALLSNLGFEPRAQNIKVSKRKNKWCYSAR